MRTNEITVDEIMTPRESVATVDQHATAAQAFELLSSKGVRHLPILNKAREVVGIVSARDFQVAGLSVYDGSVSPAQLTARLRAPVVEFMRSDVKTVGRGATLTEVIDMLLEENVGALPVIDAHTNQLAGIVSYVDVLRAVRE